MYISRLRHHAADPNTKLLGGRLEGGGSGEESWRVAWGGGRPGHDPGYEEASEPSRELDYFTSLGPRNKRNGGGVVSGTDWIPGRRG